MLQPFGLLVLLTLASPLSAVPRASLSGTGDAVLQQAYLKAFAPDEYGSFGHAVDMSGDTLVVGSPYETFAGGSGAVYVFVKSGAKWVQQARLQATFPGFADSFGCAVAVSGDTLVVGANREDSSATGVDGDPTDDSATDSGAAYVFVRSGDTWSEQAYLKASNTEEDDGFGSAVGVAGDRIVVGAPEEDSASPGIDGDGSDNAAKDSGAAYVYARNGSTWSQEAYLKSPDPEGPSDACSIPGPGGFITSYYGYEYFGSSVAIDGDTIAIGARGEDGTDAGVGGDPTKNGLSQSGAVFVFARSGSAWTQQAYVKASNPAGHYYVSECWGAGESHPGDQFGTSVDLFGDTLVVGAPKESGATSGVDGDQFAGPPWNVFGAAYVFVRDGTAWSQQAYLKASNTEPFAIVVGDGFGASVAVAGDVVVVAAPAEAGGATGVDGDGADNSAEDAGAAYVFQRSGATWSHLAYVKASNTEAFDNFGGAVSSGGGFLEGFHAVTADSATIAIGAPKEDSRAGGVNGNQSDNSLLDAGAVYSFAVCPGGGAAEVVRAGSPPNPIALLPGQTSGPVLGGVWDPVVDHGNFLPAAVFDFLMLAGAPANAPTDFGTLLCAPLLHFFTNPASSPFELPIPPNCALVGASLCFQGAAWNGLCVDGVSLQLTNALDVTIGTE